MIPSDYWKCVTQESFELLALEHVQDLYPNHNWTHTTFTGDGGKDAIGTPIGGAINDLYWMEAKHRPGSRSIGRYTLDTHLISTYFTQGRVKRLHVVTSGKFSAPFLLRASEFSQSHKFAFSFSDCEPLEAWLRLRPDVVIRYFGGVREKVESLLKSQVEESNIFARATIVPEDDWLTSTALPVDQIVPGRKYVLAVSISSATQLDYSLFPLSLEWPTDNLYLSALTPISDANSKLSISTDDITSASIFTVPFRMLRPARSLPPVVIRDVRGAILQEIPPLNVKIISSLISSFVGQSAQSQLFILKRILEADVSSSSPRLVMITGAAGSGKTRLADEMRDEAQKRGFVVKKIAFPREHILQEEIWRQLFRWLFGLSQNPFEIDEEVLLKEHEAIDNTDSLDNSSDMESFSGAIRDLLLLAKFREDIFDFGSSFGRLFSDLVERVLRRRFPRPVLVHLEDLHHLSLRTLQPLHFIRNIIETRNGLAFCLTATLRDDETVKDCYAYNFAQALDLAGGTRSVVIKVATFSRADAQDLIVSMVNAPELTFSQSGLVNDIIDRAGVNPFSIIQTLEHIILDANAITYSRSGFQAILNLEVFKAALSAMPHGVEAILRRRFEGLRQRGEGHLLDLLSATAVWGREAPLTVLRSIHPRKITKIDLRKLLSLGYLAEADQRHIALSHDMLVDALVLENESRKAAVRYAKLIDKWPTRRISSGQKAGIYFHAGSRYYRRSWVAAVEALKEANLLEDFQRALEPTNILRRISRHDPEHFMLPREIGFIAASAHQHCGNTDEAREMFEELREHARCSLGANPSTTADYVQATIQASNQYFLRARPTQAIQLVEEALAIILDPSVELFAEHRVRLRAFARNRLGAYLHMVSLSDRAEGEYLLALEDAQKGGDDYLVSHTLSDLAALLRFKEPKQAELYQKQARSVWHHRLRRKDRRRVMLDCAEAYSACLMTNNPVSRGVIYAVSMEALGKGYLFQADTGLLFFSCCSLLAKDFANAGRALLHLLNISAQSEDYRARIVALHYLSVCAGCQQDNATALHWNWQAMKLSEEDPLFQTSLLRACIFHNEQTLLERTAASVHDIHNGVVILNGFALQLCDRA